MADAIRRADAEWTRRAFLKAASLGGASALAPASAAALAADRSIRPGFGRARSCLLIVLAGGPSHLDTFDPKPDAPEDVRGEFRPIATSVPGLSFSEHLPELARRADRLAVIRSMGHDIDASHAPALYHTLTGRAYPRDPSRAEHASRDDHPHVGALASGSGVGPFVVAGDGLDARGPLRAGQHAGTLGPEHDPRVVRALADSGPNASRDAERYGHHPFGRSVLLGRRLIASGVRFVQANWTRSLDSGWDTHADGFAAMKESLLPPTDRALSALLDDLAGDGSLDETLVVVAGEFGRSPRVGPGDGRGDWPWAYSAVLAGAGVCGGRAHGATDRIGARPVDRPLGPGALAATILHALGVAPQPHDAGGDGPVSGLWRS